MEIEELDLYRLNGFMMSHQQFEDTGSYLKKMRNNTINISYSNVYGQYFSDRSLGNNSCLISIIADKSCTVI